MNELLLCGVIASEPVHSHSTRSTIYSTFKLSVKRLSGVEDLLDVIVPAALYDEVGACPGSLICVEGQLRSYNNKNAEANKLKINAWAHKLHLWDGEYINDIRLTGTICRPPVYRQTPYGREICDLMLSVRRASTSSDRPARYDYLPCICWGSVARRMAELPPHTTITLTGRFQSRNYVKLIDGQSFDRVAYEISVSQAELLPSDAPAPEKLEYVTEE